MTDEKEKQEEPKEEKLSIVDEARLIRDEIVKAKEELKQEKEALQKVQSESMLSGEAGGHVEPQPPKEVTDEEYSKMAIEGKVGDDKE